MENLTPNPTPSPLDQAYQKYQDRIIIRETGLSKEELIRGIIERKVSRDQIGRIKSELAVSSEDFFSYYYYPGQMISEPKETYQDDLMVKLKNRVICSNTFIDGVTIVGCGNQLLRIDNQNGVADVREIDKCDGFSPSLITLLPDGGILYGGWSAGSVKICRLYQKNDGGYQKEEFPKIFISRGNECLADIIARPNGKILVETESYSLEGRDSRYFRYKSKNGGYELQSIELFDPDLDEFSLSQYENRGVYYSAGSYELEVYSEKNKCLRKIEVEGPITSANLLPNGNIVYVTDDEIRILK